MASRRQIAELRQFAQVHRPTLAPESDSLALKKRPREIVHSRMAKKSGVDP